MGKINVLSFAVANLIAAGEVVDRPASVIKELMENSIDAGATRVTIEIQNGGITFMRVADNGCGMSPEDLPVSIRRHATSKIKDASDLDGIMTLGFRGEALAAIASVSHLRIISKSADEPMGAMLESVGGDNVEISEHGCPTGTTVIVEELFANVPARRKFLKKDLTEAMAVAANVERVALSRPDIAFRLIIDGQVKLETVGDGNLKSAIYAVYGKDFASRMIAVKTETDGIGVEGFISRSDNVRGNRNCQDFFINGRYVKSKTAMAALEQAYVAYLPPEKYPCCVLNLTINPQKVDVNVHPAKLEVHFSNEKPVFEAIYYTVKAALEQNVDRPDVRLDSKALYGRSAPADNYRQIHHTTVGWGETKASQAFVPVEEHTESLKKRQLTMGQQPVAAQELQRPAEQPVSHDTVPATTSPAEQPGNAAPAPVHIRADIPAEGKKPVYSETVTPAATAAVQPAPVPAGDADVLPQWRVIGQAFNAYILVERGDTLILIDQHAAHERIIFEQLKTAMLKAEPISQLLMVPIEVMMTSAETEVLNQYMTELEKIGFQLTAAKYTVTVDAIPEAVECEDVPAMLTTMADQLLQGTGEVRITRDSIFEKALFQSSCKAAIKAGREYAPGHIEWVVKQLMENPEITNCPHGRPVAIELSKTALNKQFERM